jgi:hypothetical protein
VAPNLYSRKEVTAGHLLREQINLLTSGAAERRLGVIGQDGSARGFGYRNVENVLSGLDSAEKVLAGSNSKGYLCLVVVSAFEVDRKDRGTHTIFITGEDKPSGRVAVRQAMHAIGARWKGCAANHEFKGHRYNYLVDSLCFGGNAKSGDTDKCDRNAQVQLLHYFSFVRLARRCR